MNRDGLRSVAQNLHEVQREHPPLTADEEKALCDDYAGDRKRLAEQLVLHNVGFAIAYVRKYHERCEDQEDLWMRGLQGLSDAAQAFDPSRGVRFCTFSVVYIQKAMRDLFDPLLVAPRTQLATQAVFDAPLGDEEDAPPAGDAIAALRGAADWEPVQPDADAKRRLCRSELLELVEYLTRRFGGNAKERDVLRAMCLNWTCRKIGEYLLGVSAQAANCLREELEKKLSFALRRLGKDDELHGLFNRVAKRASPGAISLGHLFRFLASRHTTIVDDVEFETAEERRTRMAEEYDAAEAGHRLATGRRDGGADYALMRTVYLDTVASTARIRDIAERRGIPATYATFLRAKAVEMVKQAKSGLFRRMVKKQGVHGCSPEEHRLKDELFNTVEYPSGFARRRGSTLDYGSLVERLSGRDFEGRARRLRRRLVTTWKNYGGGFYSESSYLRLSGRSRNGETKLTKREVRALAQFCDDISPA